MSAEISKKDAVLKNLMFGVRKQKRKLNDGEFEGGCRLPYELQQIRTEDERGFGRKGCFNGGGKRGNINSVVGHVADGTEGLPNESQRKDNEAELRQLNRIYVWGDNVPPPIRSFNMDCKVSEQLLKNLSEFDITHPTPIQMQAIPAMLKRRDLLASAPTGSGKTLAFAMPLIMRLERRAKKFPEIHSLFAVVLEPTRELVMQACVQFKKFGQNLNINFDIMKDCSIPENADVIVSTPNKLAFALCNNLVALKLSKVKWLIVDESDRLFDTIEGSDRCFRNQLANIYQACCGKHIRRAFFSATFSYEVEEWCKENILNLVMVCIGKRNAAVGSVKQELVFAGTEHGKLIKLQYMLKECFEPPALIFVQSKERARQLVSEIKIISSHIPVALVSSDRNEKERDEAIRGFRRGDIWIIVCTELMGRGLDLIGISLIINFDLPTSIISYIHRIGRAGRAGRSGRAVTYFTENDIDIVKPIANIISQAGFPVPDYISRIKKPSRKIRRKIIRRAPKRKNIVATKSRRKEAK